MVHLQIVYKDMEKVQYNVLEKVNTPADLKKLNSEELKCLCDEIRAYIIDVLANNPGHLASSLGTVELTIALTKPIRPGRFTSQS